MRLRNFLDESTLTKEEIIKTLQKDCGPFLKEIGVKNSTDFNIKMTHFYRGESGLDTNKSLHKRTTQSKRNPRGTHVAFFPIINEWLKKNGHVPRDSAVFATSSEFSAKAFGRKWLFFPIGNYDYSFIRADDFNDEGWDSYAFIWLLKEKLFKKHPKVIEAYYNEKTYFNGEVFTIKDLKNIQIIVSSIMGGPFFDDQYDCVDTYDNWEKRAKVIPLMFETNKNLIEAYNEEYEIWFKCKEYYLVDQRVLFQKTVKNTI